MAKKQVRPDPEQRARLVAGVLATPSDDAPRLVMADWLIEHADPRGEFIVLQCEAAKIPYGQQREKASELADRIADLQKRYASTWTPFFRGMRRRPQYTFHRGFISSVRVLRPERLDTTLAALLAVEPVEHLTLEHLQDDLEAAGRTFALPRISAISSLSAIAYNVNERLAELLAAAPGLKPRTLKYGHFGGDRAIELLVNAPMASALEQLVVDYGAISDAGVATLAAATGLPRLAELNLGNNQITDAGAHMLVESRGLPSLTRVHVRANNGISDAGLAALRRRFHVS